MFPLLSQLIVTLGSALGLRLLAHPVLSLLSFCCLAGFLKPPLPPRFLLFLLLVLPLRSYPSFIPPISSLEVAIPLPRFLVSTLQCQGLKPLPLFLFRPSMLLLLRGFMFHFPSGFLCLFLVLHRFHAHLFLCCLSPFSLLLFFSLNLRLR